MHFSQNTSELNLEAPYITIKPEPHENRKPLLVILHGYGKTADEYSILPRRISEKNFCYLIPQAPYRLLYEGNLGYGWLLTSKGGEDKEGRNLSEKLIMKLVEKTIKTQPCDPNRIYLMAFSQASFIATTLGLKYPHIFSKIILQGGWANHHVLNTHMQQGLEGIEFFIQHGSFDEQVPIKYGKDLGVLLSKHDAKVLFKEYQCGHEYTQPILNDVNSYLLGNTVDQAIEL